MNADLVVRNIGRLVTCAPERYGGTLGVVEDAAIAAREGTVVWIGADRDAPEADLEIDADGNAVLPGLVDCHTHLVFAGDRSDEFAARLRGEPYTTGGVRTTVTATRAASDDELRALALARLDRFAAYGVTTVEAKSGYGLSPEHELRLLRVANDLRHPVEVVSTFMGAHVVPPEHDAEEWTELVCEMMPSVAGMAEFADVWCDRGAFEARQAHEVLDAARAAGLRLKIHAEQLAHSGGAELRATSADHLEHATEDDARALAAADVVAVLLPGASMTTGAAFAPARMLIEAGARVALSTDFNPGTSYSENLQLVVAFACAHLKMTAEEAILGVTRNAAAALARDGRIGVLTDGALADLLVLQTPHEADLAYHYGVNLTSAVVAKGALVHIGA